MKQVKIRILKAKGVCRDTTVGKMYTGTLYDKGESYFYKGTSVTSSENTVVFNDDVGDQVGAWLHKGNIELVTDKPRVRVLASGRRQFDVNFKQACVRRMEYIRTHKPKGETVYKFLAEIKVGATQAYYWERQHREGHFSSERAVAFSRKKTMIHG